MELVYLIGRMAQYTKVNGKTVERMEEVSTLGLTVPYIKESGKMVVMMVMVLW